MNGNTDLIREMKKIVEDGETLDVRMRDRLFLQGLIDIYEKLESNGTEQKKRDDEINARFEKLAPVLTFYQVGMYFASAIGLGVIAFIGAMLTGQVEIVFK